MTMRCCVLNVARVAISLTFVTLHWYSNISFLYFSSISNNNNIEHNEKLIQEFHVSVESGLLLRVVEFVERELLPALNRASDVSSIFGCFNV